MLAHNHCHANQLMLALWLGHISLTLNADEEIKQKLTANPQTTQCMGQKHMNVILHEQNTFNMAVPSGQSLTSNGRPWEQC